MVGARRAVASEVGAAMVDGRGMRAAADDRGQPRAKVKLETIVPKKKSRKSNVKPSRAWDSICSYHKTVHVPYRTVPYIAKYRAVFCKDYS